MFFKIPIQGIVLETFLEWRNVPRHLRFPYHQSLATQEIQHSELQSQHPVIRHLETGVFFNIKGAAVLLKSPAIAPMNNVYGTIRRSVL